MFKTKKERLKLDILGAEAIYFIPVDERTPKVRFRIKTEVQKSSTGQIFPVITNWKTVNANKTGVSKEWKENKVLEIIGNHRDELMICYIDDYMNITISKSNAFYKEIEEQLNNKN